jgi:hypothetical protein
VERVDVGPSLRTDKGRVVCRWLLLRAGADGRDFGEGVKLKIGDFQFGWGFGEGHWSGTECGGIANRGQICVTQGGWMKGTTNVSGCSR